jgi:hypothetical protein
LILDQRSIHGLGLVVKPCTFLLEKTSMEGLGHLGVKRDWITFSKYDSHSKLNNQHDWMGGKKGGGGGGGLI